MLSVEGGGGGRAAADPALEARDALGESVASHRDFSRSSCSHIPASHHLHLTLSGRSLPKARKNSPLPQPQPYL